MRWLHASFLVMSAAMAVACSEDRIAGNLKPPGNSSAAKDAVLSSVPNPTVVGPIPATAGPGSPSHAYPFFSTTVDLASHGYVEEEFFFEGTANRYALPDLATATVIDGGYPYRTRMVVRRPASPANFNGTAVLEWQNVSAGHDFDAGWLGVSDQIMRRGYAWVGVSAQSIGVQLSPFGLRAWSPVRYGTLDVTGGGLFFKDELSYDIFSQGVQAVRHPQAVDPMGGLRVERVIALGISRAADYLARYHNSIHPLAGVIDGFSLAGGGGLVRTDLAVPVFKNYSETELMATSSPQLMIRQPPSDHFRRWEVAGASHAFYDELQAYVPLFTRDIGPWVWPGCDQPAPSRIPMQYVFKAGLDRMADWLKLGIAPPLAPDIQVDLASKTITRDADGNAMGGIRLPQHEVPTATNTGVNGPASVIWCWIMGSHVPFTPERLRELYPTHEIYVSKVVEATRAAERAGYIVGPDAAKTIAAAAQSDIGRQ